MASPTQMVVGKGTSNPLIAEGLLKILKWTWFHSFLQNPLPILIHRMVGLQNTVIAKLTLYLWHFKFHLSRLINRMTGPQNCLYREPISVKLIPHLWQITVKFNITLLTVIKFLLSTALDL